MVEFMHWRMRISSRCVIPTLVTHIKVRALMQSNGGMLDHHLPHTKSTTYRFAVMANADHARSTHVAHSAVLRRRLWRPFNSAKRVVSAVLLECVGRCVAARTQVKVGTARALVPKAHNHAPARVAARLVVRGAGRQAAFARPQRHHIAGVGSQRTGGKRQRAGEVPRRAGGVGRAQRHAVQRRRAISHVAILVLARRFLQQRIDQRRFGHRSSAGRHSPLFAFRERRRCGKERRFQFDVRCFVNAPLAQLLGVKRHRIAHLQVGAAQRQRRRRELRRRARIRQNIEQLVGTILLHGSIAVRKRILLRKRIERKPSKQKARKRTCTCPNDDRMSMLRDAILQTAQDRDWQSQTHKSLQTTVCGLDDRAAAAAPSTHCAT